MRLGGVVEKLARCSRRKHWTHHLASYMSLHERLLRQQLNPVICNRVCHCPVEMQQLYENYGGATFVPLS
jgi:hypothetical protein